MTDSPVLTSTSNDWQTLYSSEESRWQDLRRMGEFIIPIALLIFISVMSAVSYATIYGGQWTENLTGNLARYWSVFRIFITVISPVLAAFLSITLIYRATIGFIENFYKPPENLKILPLIQRRALGIPPMPPPLASSLKYPFITIKEPKLAEDHWIRFLGGPATLVIYDGIALYLERGNKFSRVVGPGKPPMPFLERYETVKAVVDLRPQTKTGTVKPWTKDGIQLTIDLRLECQIDASDEARKASLNLVYPFDPEAVKNAVESTTVGYDSGKNELVESDWLDGVWGQVTGYVNRHISKHSIDEISLADLEDVGPSKGHIYTLKLAQQHIDEINQNLANRHSGAHVLNLQLLVKFPKDVEEERIKYWESVRGKIAAIRDSKAEANRIRVREQARARVERDMLYTITERLKNIDPHNLTEPILLSLTGILDNSLDDPVIRPLIATNSLNLLEKLRNALKQKF